MILDQVKELVVNQTSVSADELDMDTSLMNDIGADSLDAVELVMKLEESLDVQLDLDRDLATIDELVKFVEEKMN